MAGVFFPGAAGGPRFRGYIHVWTVEGRAALEPCGGTDKSLAGNNFVGSAKSRRARAPIKRPISERYWVRRFLLGDWRVADGLNLSYVYEDIVFIGFVG
jgi:hypothetical protein